MLQVLLDGDPAAALLWVMSDSNSTPVIDPVSLDSAMESGTMMSPP
jgi:hypothetical protein